MAKSETVERVVVLRYKGGEVPWTEGRDLWWDELVEIAVAAETHGMESVAVSDHFQPWRHTGGHAPFSLAWMAAVGERTSHVQIGTSVMTPTFRYNPAVIAQAFATLGCLYPGRIMLGVGTGEALNEIATGFRGAGEQDWPEFDPSTLHQALRDYAVRERRFGGLGS